MSLKAYSRKSKDYEVRVETNNTAKKKSYKKFYNKYNRRKIKEEIRKYILL